MTRSLKTELLAVLIACMTLPAAGQTAEDFFREGNRFFYTKVFDSAILNYSAAVRLDPNYTDAYLMRGESRFYTNRLDEALADLNKTLALKGDYFEAYYYRGLVYERKKQDEAIEDFEKALQDQAFFIDAKNRLGMIRCSQGEYLEAIRQYTEAIKRDTSYITPCLIINIIEPLLRTRKFQEALTTIVSNESDAKNKKISAYTNQLSGDEQKEKDASWIFFRKELKPSIANLARKDYVNAIKTLTQSEAVFKVNQRSDADYQKQSYALLLSLEGYAYEQLGNIKEAIRCYEQALVIAPVQPEVTRALSTLQAKRVQLLAIDTTGPAITILEPGSTRSISVDDDKIAGVNRHIRGTITDDNGIRSAFLNNVPLRLAANGYFDTTLTLKPGTNMFVLEATDQKGNRSARPITVTVSTAAGNGSTDNGTTPSVTPVYHAVLIAEQDYQDLRIPNLYKPAADMRKIYALLVSQYSFDPANIDTLVNVSGQDMQTALTQRGKKVREGESLFIFYAGHGELLRDSGNRQVSYLVPQDAVLGKPLTYINGREFLRAVQYSSARHILIVTDACYAGSLFRGLGSSGDQPLVEKYEDISRRLLSSGNKKVVPDESIFIPYFLKALLENRDPYITAEQLIDKFKETYNKEANQQLQFLPIDYLNDQGGQFVFKRR